MTELRTLLLYCFLPLALCQCSCVRACIGFFKAHSSEGQDSRIRDDLPSRPMTLEEFHAANAHRGLSPDVLDTRFRVADADGDGLLTSGEIKRHRIKAAQNKRNAQGS